MSTPKLSLVILVATLGILFNAHALPARSSPSALKAGASSPRTGPQLRNSNTARPSEAVEDSEEEFYYEEFSAPAPPRAKPQSRNPLKSAPSRSHPPQPAKKQQTLTRKQPVQPAAPSRKSPVSQLLKPSRASGAAAEEFAGNTARNAPSTQIAGHPRKSNHSPGPHSRGTSSHGKSHHSRTSHHHSHQNSAKKSSSSKRKTHSRKTPTLQRNSTEASRTQVESSSSNISDTRSQSSTNQQPQSVERRPVGARAETVLIAKETSNTREVSMGSRVSAESPQAPAPATVAGQEMVVAPEVGLSTVADGASVNA